jgi:HEAT repeat protein
MGSSSINRYIDKIFNANELLVKSDLVNLSNLTSEQLELVKETWVKADVERRRQIIACLIQLGKDDFKLDFSNIFTFCLNDPDRTVKAHAIAGLEEEENHVLIPRLVQLLNENDAEEVRRAAITALGEFAMLGELGKIPGDSTHEVYSALLGIIKDKNESSHIKALALQAIAPLNLPYVKELIDKAYNSYEAEFKANVIRAMGRNCDPQWLTALMNELRSSDAEIRIEAANACGEIGDDEAIPSLVTLIDDMDTRVQETAIKALGEIGSDKSRQTLNKLLQNPKRRIRSAAKSALKEIDFCEDSLYSNFY